MTSSMAYHSRPYSEMERFWDELMAWSDATFGTPAERGPLGPLKHLLKEIEQEVIPNPTDLIEYVDCLFLVLDATRRAGFTYDQLMEGAFAKLIINKTRTWPKPKGADQPIEHDRSKD